MTAAAHVAVAELSLSVPACFVICAVCVAGFGGSDGSCSACPVGEFSSSAPRGEACTLCSDALGPGFTTAGNTSTSVEECNRECQLCG